MYGTACSCTYTLMTCFENAYANMAMNSAPSSGPPAMFSVTHLDAASYVGVASRSLICPRLRSHPVPPIDDTIAIADPSGIRSSSMARSMRWRAPRKLICITSHPQMTCHATLRGRRDCHGSADDASYAGVVAKKRTRKTANRSKRVARVKTSKRAKARKRRKAITRRYEEAEAELRRGRQD